MPKAKVSSREHVEAELAELRAAPQVQNAASLERGEALLTDYPEELSVDETLYVLRVCASGCQAAGRWLEGLQLSRRGIELAVREHKPREKIAFLAITGNIHSFLRNYHLAIRAMREAVAIAEQEQLGEDQVKLLQGLGPIYSRLELHDTALSLFERAYTLAGEKAMSSVRAGALNNIAREYCALGQLDAAEEKIGGAIQIAQTASSKEWLPYLLHTRAEIAAKRGKFDAALTDAKDAATQLRARTNVPVLLRVLVDSAHWLMQQADYKAARTLLEEAAKLPHDPSMHDLHEELALVRVQVEQQDKRAAQAMTALGDYIKARENARKTELASQRIAAQFVEDVERTEARGRRESAAVNELTLRLIETQAEAQRIARQVSRDPLTGVLNRSAFETAVARAASGNPQPVTLLMLDIDNFRVINTEHGHLAGDAVLEAIVERLRASLRTNDLLGRYGGDEFLLLCPGVGPRIAAAIASRVLARVANEPVVHDGKSISTTVSIGVACAQNKALSTFPYLMKRVDAALRRAKFAGKNRAVTVRVNV